MQIVDARHMELLTSEGYQNGSWEYEQIAFYEIKKNGTSGGFYGFKHMNDAITSGNILMHACLTCKSIQINMCNFVQL